MGDDPAHHVLTRDPDPLSHEKESTGPSGIGSHSGYRPLPLMLGHGLASGVLFVSGSEASKATLLEARCWVPGERPVFRETGESRAYRHSLRHGSLGPVPGEPLPAQSTARLSGARSRSSVSRNSIHSDLLL